jgi:UDP-N-acetylmuramate--alanine ligase
VVVYFQPHLYSRTRELAQRFGEALSLADVVRVLPIYGAREEPIPGVSSSLLVDAARDFGGVDVEECADGPATCGVSTITGMVRDGDIVITMGAGDITVLAPRLLKALGQ